MKRQRSASLRESRISSTASSCSALQRPQRYRFIEQGRLHEVDLRVEPVLPEVSLSPPAEEYRATLRSHYLRSKGWTLQNVAMELERSEAWVQQCWTKSAADIMPPRGLPQYISRYELRMLSAGVMPFRPPELRRGYVTNSSGLYEECVQQLQWKQASIRRRNYHTGELTVTSDASNRQDCVYRSCMTGVARLDEVIRQVCLDFDVADPEAFLVNNWYPDGKSSIGAHSHDNWSAILSFGASRIFMLDDKPILLCDGDLLIFGTQRHSLPKMPDVSDGRVSVGIFWYPETSGAITMGPVCTIECGGCGHRRPMHQKAPDGKSYCQSCWTAFLRAMPGLMQHMGMVGRGGNSSIEDEMFASALQRSLLEQ